MRVRAALACAAMLSITAADGEARPVAQSLTEIVPFDTYAFPYDGISPITDQPFLDVIEDGRRGHTSPRAGLLWEDEHYFDRSTLLHIPAGFDPDAPAALVVFFHGNQTILERDVVGRQRVPAQLEASGLNAVLAAPQLAYDAPDSSAGGFWRPRAFQQWLSEASARLAGMLGDHDLSSRIDDLPIVLVAYSGGYNPAAYALSVGGARGRVCGTILLDGPYDDEEAFVDWIARRGDGFFISAHSKSASESNEELRTLLTARGIPFQQVARDPHPAPGAVTFLDVGEDVPHEDFVTQAWRPNPLQWFLSQLADRELCAG